MTVETMAKRLVGAWMSARSVTIHDESGTSWYRAWHMERPDGLDFRLTEREARYIFTGKESVVKP